MWCNLQNLEPDSVSSFGFHFSGLDILQKVSQEQSLDARHRAEAVRPAGHCCLFIPPRNGHKVKVNSDTWHMLACPLKLYKPVHVD